MGSPSVTQATGAPLVSLVTTAETAALTSTPLTLNAPGSQGVLIQASVSGATGAGTTSMQVRVRQGSGTGGSVVGAVQQESAGASSFFGNTISVLDTAPPSPAVYTVTAQQVGASGNGTVTVCTISAEVANLGGQ